jgi:hypothetical protein
VRRDLVVAGFVAAFLALLGAGLGLIAAGVTPDQAVRFFQGNGDAIFLSTVREEDATAVAGDIVMVGVLGGAGILVGLAALLGRRVAPMGIVVGLIVGGCLGGLDAMAVAHLAVHGDYRHLPVGPISQVRPYVRGRADFVALPITALVAYLLGNVPWLVRNRRVSSETAALG